MYKVLNEIRTCFRGDVTVLGSFTFGSFRNYFGLQVGWVHLKFLQFM